MLAIPLDTKNSTTLSKLYGKAPYFALLNMTTKQYSVTQNEVVGKGVKSGDFLKSKGVTSTLFYYMGEGVYNSFVKNDMDVYTANYNEYSISQICSKLIKNELTQLTDSNYLELLNPGENEVCSCGCEKK